MANGKLSPAGQALFGVPSSTNPMSAVTGLGDLLAQQTGENAEELRKRRLAQMGNPGAFGADRAALAGPLGSMFGTGRF